MRSIRALRGFTLLELLIAISVFSIMSMMAYSGLRSVLHARNHTDEQAQALRHLQWTEMLLAGDLRGLVERPVRDDYGDVAEALRSDEMGAATLTLTRAGWPNPLGQRRSTLQRVAWGLEDGHLVRTYWPMLDRAPASTPQRVDLLDGVEGFSLRFLDGGGNWHDRWPDARGGAGAGQAEVLPRAVEVSLVTARFGEIRRLYPLDARGR